MSSRYPNTYSLGLLRPSNRARHPMDLEPGFHHNRFYINSRPVPVILDIDDEVDGFYPGGTRGSRYQDPASGTFLPASRIVSRGRNGPSRDLDLTSQVELVGDYGRRGGRTALVRERDDALPFNLAVAELSRQLEAALSFYISFGKEYTDDIKKIKQYATPEILEGLWIRKVKRARSQTGQSKNHDEVRDAGFGFAEYEDQFAIWKRRVSHALNGAIASSLDTTNSYGRGSGTSQEYMARMIDKIRTANRQLLPMLDMAWKREQLCRDLVTELKMLKDLVNLGQGSTDIQANQDNGGGGAVAGNEEAEEPAEGGVEW